MFSPESYKPRVVDDKIETFLRAFGAIALVGPRFCGKTTSGQAHSKSEMSLADSTNNFSNRHLAQVSPAAVLAGEIPRLIDEWQIVPQIWDAVRFACDEDSTSGKYILTGSSLASVKSSEIYHSGTGRIATLSMSSMSLYETQDSSGTVSVSKLFDTNSVPASQAKQTTLNDIIRFCIRGGWPKNVDETSIDVCRLVPLQYIKKVISEDIYSIPSIKLRKDDAKIATAVKVLGMCEGTTATYADYTQILSEIGTTKIGRDAYGSYIEALKKLFVVYDQPAFDLPPEKAGAKLLKTAKLRFVDPSLAIAAMNYTQQSLLQNMDALARFFDCLCVHDLKIYAERIDANIYHINEQRGTSADCIIELPDGRLGIFKHVLASANIDKAIPQLVKIKNILTNAGKEVSFMCVICGVADAVYTQTLSNGDNVIVAPITTLAP